MTANQFAKALRDFRRTSGLNQQASAKLLNVPLGTYRGWEQKRHSPVEALRRHVLWTLAKHH